MKTTIRMMSAIGAALLLLAASACNGSSSNSNSLASSVEVQDANGASTEDFASGQQIDFVLTVRNNGSTPQTFNIQPCYGDNSFLVLKQDTVQVVGGGSSPQGVVHCASVIQGGAPETIQPGKSLQYTFIWNQMSGTQLTAPGAYSVLAGVACVTDAAQCMPATSNDLTEAELTATPYRSGPVSFTIKP